MTRFFSGKGQQGPNATNQALLYGAMMASASAAQGSGGAKAPGAVTKIDPVAEALGIGPDPVVLPEAAPTPTVRPTLTPAPTVNSAIRSYNPNLPSSLDFLRPSAFKRVRNAGPGWTEVLTEDGQIIRLEGDRNWRNNNPGNMQYGPTARRKGAIGSDGRFAVFPTREAGRAAQEYRLFEDPENADKTLATGIRSWAPEFENDTEKYINTVEKRAGVSRNALLSTLTPEQRSAVIREMGRFEGLRPGQRHLVGTFDPLDPPVDLPQSGPVPPFADRGEPAVGRGNVNQLQSPQNPNPSARAPLAAPQDNQPASARFAPQVMPETSRLTLPMLQWLQQNPQLDEAQRAAVTREIEHRQSNPDLPRSGPIPPRR